MKAKIIQRLIENTTEAQGKPFRYLRFLVELFGGFAFMAIGIDCLINMKLLLASTDIEQVREASTYAIFGIFSLGVACYSLWPIFDAITLWLSKRILWLVGKFKKK